MSETKTAGSSVERSPLVVLTDLIEDPRDNGDYRLNASREELAELWRAVEKQDMEVRRLRQFAEEVAGLLHFESCPCGQCLRALRAIDALGRPRPVRHHYCLIGG